MQATQVGGIPVEPTPLQVLEALLDSPTPGVKRIEVVEAVRGKEEDEFVRRQGLDLGLPPDPVELHAGEAAHMACRRPSV